MEISLYKSSLQMQCIATHCHKKRAFSEKHEHWVCCTKSHAPFYFKYIFIRFQSLKVQELKLSRLNCLEFLSFLNTEQYYTSESIFLRRYHMIFLKSAKSQQVNIVIPLKKCTTEDEERFFITQSQNSSPYRWWVNFSKPIPNQYVST